MCKRSNEIYFGIVALVVFIPLITSVLLYYLERRNDDYFITIQDTNFPARIYAEIPKYANKYNIIIADDSSCEIVEMIPVELDEECKFTINNGGKKDWYMFFTLGLPYTTNDSEKIKCFINGEEVSGLKYNTCIPSRGSVDFTVKYELSDVE